MTAIKNLSQNLRWMTLFLNTGKLVQEPTVY